jgi:predicted nucleic acid-binding protein
MMKVAFDTNILAYAEGVNDGDKRTTALALVRRLPADGAVIPVQVLGELFNVLVRKAERARAQARDALLAWRDTFPTVETSADVMMAALDLATDHRLPTWDAVILAAASHSGCRLLLSEDLQDGFTWGGVTVANPFADARHPLLEALLSGAVDES